MRGIAEAIEEEPANPVCPIAVRDENLFVTPTLERAYSPRPCTSSS